MAEVRPFVVYSVGRVLVFAVVAALLFVAGLRSFPLVLLALLVSLPLSYVLLRRQREAFAAEVERRVAERKERQSRLRAALRGEEERGDGGAVDLPGRQER